MPSLTNRLKLALPNGNEYVNRAVLNKIFEDIDIKVATIEETNKVLIDAKKYADEKSSTDSGQSLSAAKKYTDDKAANTLSDSKKYTDAGDAAVNKALADILIEIAKKVDKSGDTITGVLNVLRLFAGTTDKQAIVGAGTNDVYLSNSLTKKYLQLKDDGVLAYGGIPVALSDIAQMKKITNDNGSQTISVSDTTKNVLDEIVAKGAGLNTIYCNTGVQGQTPDNASWRGISFLNQSDIGLVIAKDYRGKFWTNYVNGKNNWIGWVQHASIDDVNAVINKAQMKKITTDAGGVTISISDATKNILDEIVNTGLGMNTIYAKGGIQGNVPSGLSWRGFSHINSTGYGYVFAKDYQNRLYTNYLDNGKWLGWVEHPNLEQVIGEINKRTEDKIPSRSGKDENGIFTTYEETQEDGNLWKRSVLSSPDADGNYLVRTVTYYKDGVSYKTKTFDLKYDEDGDFVKAVPR
ncbi:hypothetical protein ACWKTJ_06820 [Bacillus wiedmannii]